MEKKMITGQELIDAGWKSGPAIGELLSALSLDESVQTPEEQASLAAQLLENPSGFTGNFFYGGVAKILTTPVRKTLNLKETGIDYKVYGAGEIEEGAIRQMEVAAKLPVAVAGALMPDAHQGYGLPIGGVLATDNAIIPYAVGVDIGCRMCLSIFPTDPEVLETDRAQYQRELVANTLFGAGRDFGNFNEDAAVLHDKVFDEVPFVKSLKDKAARQLGSSGSGNHFVEFGIVEVTDQTNAFGVVPGRYLGLLSHSGSRGLGANIANYYTKLAKEKTPLPDEAKHLAWLDMEKEEGIEYWLAMNLAGDYASACHHSIHNKVAKAIGQQPIARIENHHNFAWKEFINGKEVIVHRKGATPAEAGVLGIIPGSMAAPGFIVQGKGESASVNSASHGAGRKMSRTQAFKVITREQMKSELKEKGITLLGGAPDEAPDAYKNIHQVMSNQTELVNVLGSFHPRIVLMDGSSPARTRKKRNGERPPSEVLTGE